MLRLFMIFSLIVSVLLNVIYRILKKKEERTLYSTLIGLNLVGIALELVLSYFRGIMVDNVLVVSLLERFYQLYSMLIMLFLTLLLYSLSYRKREDKKSYYKRIRNLTYYFFYVAAVLMLFAPIELYEEGVTTGMAVDIVYLYSVTSMLSWLASDIKNIKKLKQKSFVPYAIYVIVFVIGILSGHNLQSIGILASSQLYVLLAMLLTMKREKNTEEVPVVLPLEKEGNKSTLSSVLYDPAAIISELIANAKRHAGEKIITFKFTQDEDIPKNLEGDLIIVRGIISEIVNESVKNMQMGELRVNLDSVQRNGICKLIVTIENNGGGYKESDFRRLFDSEENSSLSSTKYLVEQMGGKLVTINESGIGTKFILALEQSIKI